MRIIRVSVISFLMVIVLNVYPSVSAVGDFTVDLYENVGEVTFSEGQQSQIIYFKGAVNYTGYSVSGDTISLSSSSDLGETSISPEEVIFHTTGTEDFTVVLTIPNIYENGTSGTLTVNGLYHQGGTSIGYGETIIVQIINQSYIDNDNLNGSDNGTQYDNPLRFESILLISTIFIIAIVILIIFKKYYNKI